MMGETCSANTADASLEREREGGKKEGDEAGVALLDDVVVWEPSWVCVGACCCCCCCGTACARAIVAAIRENCDQTPGKLPSCIEELRQEAEADECRVAAVFCCYKEETSGRGERSAAGLVRKQCQQIAVTSLRRLRTM